MRQAMIFPLEILLQERHVRATDVAVEYVRAIIGIIRAAGVEIVDWAFDPSAPRPVLENGLHDAKVRLLMPGELRDHGLILVQILVAVGDLAEHIGVVADKPAASYVIPHDYVPGEAFPAAVA